MKRLTAVVIAPVIVMATCVAGLLLGNGSTPTAFGLTPTPIQHVVVFYQENHSFNNLLGAWCVQTNRCAGTTTGVISTGQTIPLTPAPDVVPIIVTR